MKTLNTGDKGPRFDLKDQNGQNVRLSDFAGKKLFLYFYPKANTSGWATQAKNVRDVLEELKGKNIAVIGISPDSPEKHSKFKEKYLLPFTLLADEGHQVCELFGVWGTKNSYGREYDGVFRTTFVIDSNGQIVKVFEKVKPADNSAEVLALIEELGKAG